MFAQIAIILLIIHLIGGFLYAALGIYRSFTDRKSEHWAGILIASFIAWEILFIVNIIVPMIEGNPKIEQAENKKYANSN